MSDYEQVTPPDTPPPEEAMQNLDIGDNVDVPSHAPPPIPSFPPDFPPEHVVEEPVAEAAIAPHEEEEEDAEVEHAADATGSVATAATATAAKGAEPAGGPYVTSDFFIIRKRKENFLKPPIYSIELYNPEGTPASTYRIYAQITTGLKPYFSISGDKEDFGKKREKRSHLFVGKLVVEKAKKIYIGAMQNTEDRTKSHVVSIVFDPRMEVAITLVPTETLHDEFMLMRVNGTQNRTRVNELFVLKDVDDVSSMSQIVPMLLNGKRKAVPSATLFALTKCESSWGKGAKVEESKFGNNPEGFLYMQVGKIRESKLYPEETTDTYSCQFQDPVTMLTAFMIILSHFDATK